MVDAKNSSNEETCPKCGEKLGSQEEGCPKCNPVVDETIQEVDMDQTIPEQGKQMSEVEKSLLEMAEEIPKEDHTIPYTDKEKEAPEEDDVDLTLQEKPKEDEAVSVGPVDKTIADPEAKEESDTANRTVVDSGKAQKKISDRYELLDELGRGGMGVVYKARDLKLGREVALKRILKSFDMGVARFFQEAQAVAKLNNPNVVTVHDTGEDEVGPWMVMEYIDGGRTLKEMVEERGVLPPEEIVSIGLCICRALSHAHRMGVIHRDVKPANVLVTPEGTPKLSDFGLARDGRGEDLSVTGNAMGTGGFAAPEQMVDAKNVDHRADIYGLGALLFQLCTGKRPHVVKESMIPEQFRAVVLKALAERPEDRFFDINEMAVKLQTCLKKPEAKKKKSHMGLYAFIFIILMAVGSVGAFYVKDFLEKQQTQGATDEELSKLAQEIQQFIPTWDKEKINTSQEKFDNLFEKASEEAQQAAAPVKALMVQSLLSVEANTLLKEQENKLLDDMDALTEARRDLKGIRNKVARDKKTRVDALVDKINVKIGFLEFLGACEETQDELSSKATLYNEMEELNSRESTNPWEGGLPEKIQTRVEAYKANLNSKLKPFLLLEGIDKNRKTLAGDEAQLRQKLQELANFTPPTEVSELYDELNGFLKDKLLPFESLKEIRNIVNNQSSTKEDLKKAESDLQSLEEGELHENVRTVCADLRAETSDKLVHLLVMEYLDSFESKKQNISEDKAALTAELGVLDGKKQLLKKEDPDLTTRFNALTEWINSELAYLEVKPYMENPDQIKDLYKAKDALERYVAKYSEGKAASDASILAVKLGTKINEAVELDKQSHKEQQDALAVIRGEMGKSVKERLVQAQSFLKDWPDHESNEEVSGLLPSLRKDAEKEKLYDQLLTKGFKFLKEESFSCGNARNTVKIFSHEKTGLEFVLLMGGSFQMGSPDTEKGRVNDESPQHRVTLKPFLICRTEMTQGPWRKVMDVFRFEKRMKSGDNFPVTHVTWDECNSFCAKTGLKLPSEAQWEYACRAGVRDAFCFGNSYEDLPAYAWFYDNSHEYADSNSGRKYIHQTGQKKPNAFGLFDMHGNVSEWCQDAYSRDYRGVSDDGAPRVAASSERRRMVRGGSWRQRAGDLRSAKRNSCDKRNEDENEVGFRPIYPIE